MPADPSTLELAEIAAGLAGTPFAEHMHAFGSIGSTNTLAVEAAQAGAQTGVWVADEQTAGRGRGGHTWHSAPGDGLYVSVLLRPKLSGAEVLKISLAAGLAAVNSIRRATGAVISLRWPNDLMEKGREREGRKLGGILTESALESGEGRLSYAVVGIGMNLNQRAMPPHLEGIATSLRMSGLGQSQTEDTRREVLLPLLVRELAGEVRLLEREAAGEALAEGILARFEAASPAVRGVRVRVAEEGGYTGVTDGLEATGLLRVRADDGSLRIVRHGGVRRADPAD